MQIATARGAFVLTTATAGAVWRNAGADVFMQPASMAAATNARPSERMFSMRGQ